MLRTIYRRPNQAQSHSLRRAERGQAVIEFALLLPILLLLVFGITEFGRALMTVNVLNAAAREGARVACVGGDSTAVVTRILAVLDAANINAQADDILVVGPDANRAVTVTVGADFAVLSAKVLKDAGMLGTIRLRGRTVMRFEG